jgi:hypothetical protein
MKYIMFQRGDQLVPVIFPDFITHREVAKALQSHMTLSRTTIASAGSCEVYCMSTTGESSTLDKPSIAGDAQIISTYDYTHGTPPIMGMHVQLVKEALRRSLDPLAAQAEDAAIDNLFDRSEWPPDKLRDIHRETAAEIFGVPESEVTPEQRARARTINYSTIYGGAKKVPHDYVPTDPYKGCGECGFGPGAAVHNSHEVRRHKEETAKPSTACTSYCGCMGDDPECPVHGNPNQG